MLLGAIALAQPVSALGTAPAVTTTTLPAGEEGVAYSAKLAAVGGTAPYTWSLASGTLPEGLSLTSHGVISGTPSAAATQNATFEVIDAANATASALLGISIAPGPAIVTGPLPQATAGVSYSVQMNVIGGTPPYNWTVASGPLPLGTVLLSTGVLSGIPSALGTTTTTIQVSDALGVRTSSLISVQVAAPTVVSASYFTTSTVGGVSVYATPGSTAPQTGAYNLSGVVAIGTDEAGDRYWVVTSAGRVVASPRAPSFGSVAKRHVSGSIVGIAVEPHGDGYLLASSTGRVYGFGAAHSFGSVAKRSLSGVIVGIALNAGAAGYWLVSSTGRIYAFGSAHRLPQISGKRLHRGVVGIAGDPTASGFWMVARSGRVATYGNAAVLGSIPGGEHVNDVAGIASDQAGDGYWILTESGDVFPRGAATSLPGVEVAPDPTVTAIAGAT
jgi:hypothetical protein